MPDDIEDSIRQSLKEQRPRPWWSPLDHIRAHLVRGRPWVEDLYRPPSRRIKVSFVPEEAGTDASEISQEQLYSIFRPYGKLLDILPQPADSKVVPKFALIDFRKTRRAIMATNCLHGLTVKEELGDKALARLKISYEQQTSTSWIRDWILNHPRIVIPILVALVAFITVTVFDPMRTFFIKTHIDRTFHVEDNRLWQWFASRVQNLFTFARGRGRVESDFASSALLEDRKRDIEQIQDWLMESADNFIVIQGPRGSGKKELIWNHTIHERTSKLLIDCKPIQEARTEAATIAAAAEQVGYRPVFSWMNSISGLLDLAAQSATGVKAGFSETLDSQLDKILNNTTAALKQVALADKKHDLKDAKMDDDSYLEAHPERRPVVVIDNFLHKSQDSSIVYDKLADWAARITASDIAHVIFLTTDVSYSKGLSKALPDHTLRHLSLDDFKPDVAKRFVLSHLQPSPSDTPSTPASPPSSTPSGPTPALPPSRPPPTPLTPHIDPDELDAALHHLGGRLTDLEYLARRLRTGEPPGRAVAQIIAEAASEILKLHLLPAADAAAAAAASPTQAWSLVKALAAADPQQLRYHELAAAAGDDALAALEAAELIAVLSANGRPFAVVPAAPVYGAAFRSLAADRVLAARLDLRELAAAVRGEEDKIARAEEEVRVLVGIGGKGKRELRERGEWLVQKIGAGQRKVREMEAKMAAAKEVLASEF